MTVPQKGKVFSHEFLLGETFLQSPVAVAKGCFGLTSPFKYMGFPGGSAIKNPLANAGHSGLMPGSGRSPGASENESESLSLVSDSLQSYGLYNPWNSPGQNIGVGSLSLLQGIFPTQGLNPDLPHCRQILYQLSHQGSPRILEWVAYPFYRGSS